jgi:hypothetical protein
MNVTTMNARISFFKDVIEDMSIAELNAVNDMVALKLDAVAQKHMAAIRAAIEAAKNDGFSVVISHEGDLDLFGVTPDDEEGFDVLVH